MRAQLLVLALGAVSLSAAAPAEPAKPPVHKAAQPAEKAPAVVVASAEEPSVSSGDTQPKAAPATKRRARVTSCRCGDQNPGK